MYIDTHCHLSKEDYDDIFEVIKENRKNHVDRIIVSGYSKDSINEVLQLSLEYEDVYLTLGYHPSEADMVTKADLDLLEQLIKENSKVLGIGEIGLDYHYGKENKEHQIELFKYQLSMAEKHDLPVVIHTRDATQDTIDILKKYHVRGVIHCFSGSLEVAEQYISMGFLLGIGGVLTFKNSNLCKVIEKIPLDKIVLETDSPYLTPHPYRGKINSSKYISIIAEKIATIKEISLKEVAKITTINAIKVFDLK